MNPNMLKRSVSKCSGDSCVRLRHQVASKSGRRASSLSTSLVTSILEVERRGSLSWPAISTDTKPSHITLTHNLLSLLNIPSLSLEQTHNRSSLLSGFDFILFSSSHTHSLSSTTTFNHTVWPTYTVPHYCITVKFELISLFLSRQSVARVCYASCNIQWHWVSLTRCTRRAISSSSFLLPCAFHSFPKQTHFSFSISPVV